MTTSGTAYWLTTLRPLARDGYKRGVLTDLEVVLINEATEHEVHLPRPRADGWSRADLLLPAIEPDDVDPELRRGITYLMKAGKDRMELSA